MLVQKCIPLSFYKIYNHTYIQNFVLLLHQQLFSLPSRLLLKNKIHKNFFYT